ncbi:MAG: response regulator [Myxococcota bacterium]
MTESPPPAEAFRPPSFILNVNDDEASRYLTSRILGQAGYTVREAVDGTGALTMAMDGPSLIVLDVKLPDMTGLEVCRILKADPRTTHIPILQTSATYVSAERKVAGLEAGADAYLAQPIEPPELIANVRALLRARLAEEALYEAGREWQQTFDALQDAVAVIGPSGKPLRLNPTMREVLAGEPVEGGREALDRFLGRQLDAAVDEVRGTGSRTTLTTRHGEREYRVVIDPVGAQTTVHRMILVASDITLEKRLAAESQERAREFEEEARRKDEFLAMLAHELRNRCTPSAPRCSFSKGWATGWSGEPSSTKPSRFK